MAQRLSSAPGFAARAGARSARKGVRSIGNAGAAERAEVRQAENGM
jgi:hypothetical protein